MKINTKKNQDGFLQVECVELEKWKDGEKLVRFLKREFFARVTKKVEGPDSRRWFLTVEKVRVSVDQSDWGDLAIAALEINGEPVIVKIAERLKTVPVDFEGVSVGPFEQLIALFRRR